MEGPIEVTITERRCTDCSFLRTWGGYHCASEGIGRAIDAEGNQIPMLWWICSSPPVRTPSWCPVLGRGGES